MVFLTGKDYPYLCERCRNMIDAVVELVEMGPDTDDEEAPLMFAGDNNLLCGGYHCVAADRLDFETEEEAEEREGACEW